MSPIELSWTAKNSTLTYDKKDLRITKDCKEFHLTRASNSQLLLSTGRKIKILDSFLTAPPASVPFTVNFLQYVDAHTAPVSVMNNKRPLQKPQLLDGLVDSLAIWLFDHFGAWCRLLQLPPASVAYLWCPLPPSWSRCTLLLIQIHLVHQSISDSLMHQPYLAAIQSIICYFKQADNCSFKCGIILPLRDVEINSSHYEGRGSMHNIIMSVAVSGHNESNPGHLQTWSLPIAQNSTQLRARGSILSRKIFVF